MSRARAIAAGALIFWASCNKSDGEAVAGPVVLSGPPAKPSGPSFSTEVAKDLGLPGLTGKAAAAADAVGSGGADPKPSGKASKPVPAAAQDAKPGPPSAPTASAPSPKPGAAGAPVASAPSPKPGAAGALVASAPTVAAPSAGGAKPVNPVALASPPAPSEPPPVAAQSAGAGRTGTAPHGPIKVPAELASIKLSLLPNWDRDVDAPGTFQYVVRIKGTQSTKTFTFHYGYDDPAVPAEETTDQYKKYLQETKRFLGDIRDRQRGGALFLEGNDSAGMPSFRYVVLYSGHRLVCYGSLYKDAESNRLGDDRDQTLIQAKQICETLAL
jgi:hypothetical protein